MRLAKTQLHGRRAGDMSPLFKRQPTDWSNRGLTPPARPAFTLIEMLVVIFIILVLASMMVMITPNASARSQSARAAGTLQGALLYAKNRARMNMLPTGVQINTNTVNNVWVGQGQTMMVQQDTLQFIQSGGDFTSPQSPPQGGAASPDGVNITVAGLSMPLTNITQQGDYFELAGSGLPHMIAGVGATNLSLASPLPGGPVTQLVSYRIMRQPRQLFGEAPVELPQNYSVDLPNSLAFVMGNPVPPPFSVLFAPSGVLTGITIDTTGKPQMGAAYDQVCYVVRDTTQGGAWQVAGFPTIVVVNGKTGFVTAHPVNLNGNPFAYALGATSSGM